MYLGLTSAEFQKFKQGGLVAGSGATIANAPAPTGDVSQKFNVPASSYSGGCPPGSVLLAPGTDDYHPALCAPIAQSAAPAPAPAPAPNLTNNNTITVSPTIQTEVSPQISPVFQQSYMPSGSPMTAGTTQQGTAPQASSQSTPSGNNSASNLDDLIKLMTASSQSALPASAPAVNMPQYSAPAPMPESSPVSNMTSSVNSPPVIDHTKLYLIAGGILATVLLAVAMTARHPSKGKA